MIRVLQPGGVLMFQLPEVMSVDSRRIFEEAPVSDNPIKQRLPRPLVLAWRKVKYAFLTTSTGPQMEMFGMNRPDVETHIRAAGGRLLEAKPDNSHGLEGNGYEYWVTKG
jgi:hypothetical protein